MTREQDNFAERVASEHGASHINLTSPRPECIQITAPDGHCWDVNQDGISVHECGSWSLSAADWS